MITKNGRTNNRLTTSIDEDKAIHTKQISTDNTSFAARLRIVIGQRSMTDFAQACQLSESAVRKYIRGDSEPTLQNLLVISKVGNVSLSWLATGIPDETSQLSSMPEFYPPQPIINRDNVIIYEVDFDSLCQEKLSYKLDSYWMLSKKWLMREGLQNNTLALTTINCDSMAQSAKYGDMALINIKQQGWQGALEGVFIIQLNDNLLIKRLQYDPVKHGYYLYSDCSLYRDHFIAINQSINFKIIAKIVHILNHVV
ncbi:helix-turn-helix domain-containing protein [Utexia brackfieldae]|uniref:XRE family transcriptional regulator n=1 Tax=Utexia brackfieldae TaxID=3074108 RepID=UPI00370D5D87